MSSSMVLRRAGVVAVAVAALALAWHQPMRAQVDAATPKLAKEEVDGIIFERQQIMLQLDRDGRKIGEIAAGIAPASDLAAATRSLAQGARDSVTSFAAKVPGGRSKPEVWSNYPDFMERMEHFARGAEAMANAGERGDVTAVTGLMIEGMPCKQCHDLYREPKKS